VNLSSRQASYLLLLSFWLFAPSIRAAVISEFMAANVSILADEDGEFSDWIEIRNDGATVLDLGNWSLTDERGSPARWQFPSTNLPPGSHLLVFASGKDRRIPGARLHTNFKLSSDGEYLALVDPQGNVASAFSPAFPSQRRDISYGLANGTPVYGYMSTPTPGASNTETTLELIKDTRFNHDRGFYNANFDLIISCDTPGASIYFTTNGSSPSATSGTLYTSPIEISRTSTIRARAEKPGGIPSNVDTQTYIFLDDVINLQPDGSPPPGWPSTWGQNAVDYGMDPQIVSASPYNATIKDDLLSIPTLSLVMRLGDLFDSQTGIYANPEGDKREWERPCSLELIYPDGRNGFQVDAGARIRGGVGRSRTNPKHSFRFLFRDDYGDSKLKYRIMGDSGAAEFDGFDLRAAQNSWWFDFGEPDHIFIADPFSRDTLLAMGQPTERGDYFHLYINGQYWGVYNSCERPEASYAASYFGGVPEDYDVLKPDFDLGATMQATDGDTAAWTRLWEAAVAGFSSNADYFAVQGRNPDGTSNPALENLLNVTNLIDYLLLITWTGNTDGPVYGQIANGNLFSGFVNNYYAFRSRRNTEGFRFVVHDAEFTLGNLNENRVVLTTSIGSPANGDDARRSNPYFLWMRLLQNTEFRQLLADRIQKHFFGNGALTRETTTARFKARQDEIDRAIVGESARWGDAKQSDPITREDWKAATDFKFQNYFPFRTDVVLGQLRDAGLFSSFAAPLFSKPGGEVPVGFSLQISNSNSAGEIFYTADGTDPRSIGGTINPSAINYAETVTILTSTLIRARVKNGATWSPLVEAAFYPSQDFTRLRITELMYHPPGSNSVSGDQFEFLELKNTGPNAIDLGGASFSGISFTFTNGTHLAPGEFFLLGRDLSNFAYRYPDIPLNGIFSGRLDNGGEDVSLKTHLGVEVLSLTYDDIAPWPITPDSHGFSLVPDSLVSASTPRDPRYWRASTHPGGSPGADDPLPSIPRILINEVLTHTDPPTTDTVELNNPTSDDVDLSGWFLSDDPGSPTKFRIPDGTTIPANNYLTFTEEDFNPGGFGFALSSTGDDLYLLSGSQTGTNLTGYSYGLRFGAAANGVSFGRYLDSTGGEHFPPQTTTSFGSQNTGPRIGPVVISEVHYHPLINDLEFIELQNITTTPVPLFDPNHSTNTWQVNGIGFIFPANVTLQAQSIALIVNTNPAIFRAQHNIPDSVLILGPFTGTLQDSGERLELQRPDAPNLDGSVPLIVVDSLRYNDRAPWPIEADGGGSSLQRRAANAFSDDPQNWIAVSPTPGTATQAPDPDSDADGLPDDWERLNGTLLGVADASADPDGDGLTNLQEYRSGTHPSDSASSLRLLFSSEPGNIASIRFTRVGGISYQIEYCTDLSVGSWLILTNVPPTSTTATYGIEHQHTSEPQLYLRVQVP
jgi:hypothetical protein